MSSAPLSVEIVRRPAATDGTDVERLVRALDNGHYEQYVHWSAIDTEVAVEEYRLYTGTRTSNLAASALLRIRRVGRLGFRVAEIPGGPVFLEPVDLAVLAEAVADDVAASGVVRLTMQPRVGAEHEEQLGATLAAAGFGVPDPPACPATLIVDLPEDPLALLASFRKQTRYDVRRALREGVRVREGEGAADARAFQRLYDAMARKGATHRPAPFFERLFTFLADDPRLGFVLLAEHGRETIAGTVVMHHGNRAIYAFGASDPSGPAVPKGHLLQYEAMCRARSRGALVYDLNGFTAGTGTEGSRSRVQQVNLWKRGFGGTVVQLLPARCRVFRRQFDRWEQLERRVLGALGSLRSS